MLLSLFLNLIDNARKALAFGGHIQVLGKAENEEYKVSIIDDGCGIPEEQISKITEAFYMVDKSRARKEGGAGLGLSLCSKIIQVHHGKWQIESRKGAGTSVFVWFSKKENEK